jgi:hypothetical protein
MRLTFVVIFEGSKQLVYHLGNLGMLGLIALVDNDLHRISEHQVRTALQARSRP